jgi:hypothetical protein
VLKTVLKLFCVKVTLLIAQADLKSEYINRLLQPSLREKLEYALKCHHYSVAVFYESMDTSRSPVWTKILGLLKVK